MKFEITSKNKDGEVIFQGTANQTEASFLLEVGMNFLLSNGAMPLLTGETDEVVADEPGTMQ